MFNGLHCNFLLLFNKNIVVRLIQIDNYITSCYLLYNDLLNEELISYMIKILIIVPILKL